MKDIYFNEYEFKKAFKLTDTDLIKSTSMYEEYLRKYPKDYSTYPFYASNLISLGRLEEAEQVIEEVERKSKRDSKFCGLTKTYPLFKKTLFFVKTRLLAYQKKYDELYEFCMMNRKLLSGDSILFYAKSKLGMIDLSQRDCNSYLYRQIVRYEEEDFLDHVKKHMSDCRDSVSVFDKDFSFNEVLGEIKKHIPSDKKTLIGLYENAYYFRYDNCGQCDYKSVNFIKVICFDDTGDIITMYPCSEGENFPFVDLNYMRGKETEKVKKISQIDKFNRRFGLKN